MVDPNPTMENLDIFTALNLELISKDWVDSIWLDSFLEFSEPPEDYILSLDNEDINTILKDTCSATKSWVNESLNPKVYWNTLKNINIKSLLAVLGYLIKSGHRLSAGEDSRQSCLRATSLYLNLLSIPGSNVLEIFHPNLFELALDSFKLLNFLTPTYKKQNRSHDLSELYDLEDERTTLTLQEKLTLTQGLNGVMYDLISTLPKFVIKNQERSLEALVVCLIEVAKAETTSNPLTIETSSRASLATLSYNAYIALKELCQPNHGTVQVTIQLILKYVYQQLLANPPQLPPKNLTVLKNTVLTFLEILLDSHEGDAEKGFRILVQHLLNNCPERLEARQKQASVVARIVNLCQGNLLKKQIESLVVFGHHSTRIVPRIFALEVAGKLLLETPTWDQSGDEDELELRSRMRRILIGLVLAKCSEASNMARGKAMAILTELTERGNVDVFREEFDAMFDEANVENPLPQLEVLRSALEKDVNCLAGSRRLLQMLFRRVEDDRALIRRSTLQILRNITILRPSTLDEVVALMGRHCRDLSVVVRKSAIQFLTQMLQEAPGNERLLDNWVRNVVPRIFDVDGKVQEKVLEAMSQVIVGELKTWSDLGDDDLELPWRVIDKLMRLRMRAYLSKACSKWVQAGSVNEGCISRVRSHIDTPHEVQAWFLLATFSESICLKNVDVYLRNYNELLRSESGHVSFMLEVLKNSWSRIDKTLLQKMQADIYQSLCQFEINHQYISICIDILDRIMQPNGERLLRANMLALMKSAELKINRIFTGDDSCDICPLRAMLTLGNASFLCTGNITPDTLSLLQNMLLDWDSLPGRRHILLRPFGIRLLGQLGIRDREIAQQVTPILSHLMCQSSTHQSATETSIRVNAAQALADYCEQFTALVDPYLPEMCVCMKDPNPRVREAIVVIFIQLLLEDYIKVKGVFFFHILTMIADPDETIRELTVFLVKERLIVKNKSLIQQEFVAGVFHYNDCRMDRKVDQMSEKERAVLMLSAGENEAKRRSIYDFMMEQLEPTGKVSVTRSLTKVLHSICEGTLVIAGENEMCLLKDMIYILSSEYMQPNFHEKRQNDEEAQEEGATGATNGNESEVNNLKRVRVQQLMPVLVKLEAKLKELKSPVVQDVTRFFVQMVLEFSKEPLTELQNEFLELESRIEDIRKNGKKQLNEEEGVREKKNAQKQDKTLLCAAITLKRLSNETIAQLTRSPGRENEVDSSASTSSKGGKGSRSRSSSISSRKSLRMNSPIVSNKSLFSSTPIPFKSREQLRDLEYSAISDDESD